jgi:hypothetical protein
VWAILSFLFKWNSNRICVIYPTLTEYLLPAKLPWKYKDEWDMLPVALVLKKHTDKETKHIKLTMV